MKGYSVKFGDTVTFNADHISVENDGTGTSVLLDTDDGWRVRLTPAQAKELLIGLRLTGTHFPDWLC